MSCNPCSMLCRMLILMKCFLLDAELQKMRVVSPLLLLHGCCSTRCSQGAPDDSALHEHH